jgi:hypothetical protein
MDGMVWYGSYDMGLYVCMYVCMYVWLLLYTIQYRSILYSKARYIGWTITIPASLM